MGGSRVTFSKHENFVPASRAPFGMLSARLVASWGLELTEIRRPECGPLWVIWLKSSNLIGQIRFSKITSPTIRHSHQNTYIDYVPQNSLTIQIQRENKPRLRHTLTLDDNLGQGKC